MSEGFEVLSRGRVYIPFDLTHRFTETYYTRHGAKRGHTGFLHHADML